MAGTTLSVFLFLFRCWHYDLLAWCVSCLSIFSAGYLHACTILNYFCLWGSLVWMFSSFYFHCLCPCKYLSTCNWACIFIADNLHYFYYHAIIIYSIYKLFFQVPICPVIPAFSCYFDYTGFSCFITFSTLLARMGYVYPKIGVTSLRHDINRTLHVIEDRNVEIPTILWKECSAQ